MADEVEAKTEEPTVEDTSAEGVEEEVELSEIDQVAAHVDRVLAENAALKAEIETLKGSPAADKGEERAAITVADLLARFNGTDSGNKADAKFTPENPKFTGEGSKSYFEKIVNITPDDLH